MPFEKKMPLPFFAQVNSNMLVIEEAVRQQPGAKTTMDEEILAKVRMAREEMVAGWIGPKDAGCHVYKRGTREKEQE